MRCGWERTWKIDEKNKIKFQKINRLDKMDALISTLAFRKVPTVEIDKKRKPSTTSEKQSVKRPRLLTEVLEGEVEPSLVPSHTTEGMKCTIP